MSLLLFYGSGGVVPTPTGVRYMLLLSLTSGATGTAPVTSAPNVYVNRMVRVGSGKYEPMEWWLTGGEKRGRSAAQPFKFSEGIRRSAAAKANAKATLYKPGVEKEEALQPIQGFMPGSVQEWRVARALDKLKLDYDYQKGIGGGRRVRGGQVVDFWVYTAPYPTPVFIQGSYWHNRQSEMEDRLKQEKVQRIYRGQVMPNVLLDEEDLGSMEAAYRTVRRRLIG